MSVRTCQGNDAPGRDYDGQVGHRYFDTGRYNADKVCKSECSSCLVAHDTARRYVGPPGNGQPGVGAVDVRDPAVGAAEVVAHRTPGPPLAFFRTGDHCKFVWLQPLAGAGMDKLLAMTKAKQVLGR